MEEQARWSGGDPAELTAMTLVRAFHSVRRRFVALLGAYDVTPQQFSALVHLVDHPGRGQAELAREVLATPQSVGELLRVMEDRGLVERTAPTRRGLPIAVHASPAGRALLDAITPLVVEAFSPEALGLDQRSYDRLNADLHTIVRTLAL